MGVFISSTRSSSCPNHIPTSTPPKSLCAQKLQVILILTSHHKYPPPPKFSPEVCVCFEITDLDRWPQPTTSSLLLLLLLSRFCVTHLLLLLLYFAQQSLSLFLLRRRRRQRRIGSPSKLATLRTIFSAISEPETHFRRNWRVNSATKYWAPVTLSTKSLSLIFLLFRFLSKNVLLFPLYSPLCLKMMLKSS